MTDVFLGFVFDESKEKELLSLSKCGLQTAANQYQIGFLSGLEKKATVFSVLSVGAYPHKNKRLVYKGEIVETSFATIHYTPFVNFYGIRDKMFEHGLYHKLKKVVQEQTHTTIYVYSLFVPFLKVIKKMKKIFADKITIVLIIPDLPGKYGIMRNKYTLAGIKDRLDFREKMTLPVYADRYVFLTESMKELFPMKPYTVIEGFLPQSKFDYTAQRKPYSILYTGSLNGAFGIEMLLRAFEKIDDDKYELWICGSGNQEKLVVERAHMDRRIKFMGYLPKQDIMELQTRCDILINPRSDKGNYTKYSFPSKTMEYILSGSKVVMYRLNGVGEDYYDFIYTIENGGVEQMIQTIISACEDQEFYRGKWKKQIEWIQNNKNAKAQCKKMKEMI